MLLLGEHHGDQQECRYVDEFQQLLHFDDSGVSPIYHYYHDVIGRQYDVLHDDLHV